MTYGIESTGDWNRYRLEELLHFRRSNETTDCSIRLHQRTDYRPIIEYLKVGRYLERSYECIYKRPVKIASMQM